MEAYPVSLIGKTGGAFQTLRVIVTGDNTWIGWQRATNRHRPVVHYLLAMEKDAAIGLCWLLFPRWN